MLRKNLQTWSILVVIMFSLVNDIVATSILDPMDIAVELNCDNDICKCVRSQNFDVDTLEKQLKSFQISDTALLACAYHQLGVLFHYNDQYTKAILYYKEAIRLREQFDDGWLWKSQLNLAFSFFLNNQNKQALIYLEKSQNQNGNPKRSKDSIMLYNFFASAYKEIGELDNALQFAKKATTVSDISRRKIKAQTNYAEILISTADSTNLRNGISILDSLIKIDDQSIKENLDRINNILGNAYSHLNEFGKSNQYYTTALQLLDNDASKAIMSGNIATVYTSQNNLNLAFYFLNLSLQLNKTYFEDEFHYMYAANHENFGDYFIKTTQAKTALQHYQKALINLTNNFRTEDIHQNPNPKDSTLFIYSNPDMIRVLHLKATAAYQYYQQNNNQKYLNLANQTYQTAFDFHDQLQKDISTENSRLFQAKNIVSYIENALKVAYELQKKGEDISKAAFRFMEKNKATVLLQSMNEADALQFSNLPDSLLEQEKDLKIALTFHHKQLIEAIEVEEQEEVNRLNDLLFEEKQQYSQLINQLENNYPDYYQLKYKQNQTLLVDVQNQLDDKTALLEYFVGDSSIYILSIQKDTAKLYQIKKPENWQQTIHQFQNCLNPKEVMKDEYTEALFKSFTQNGYIFYKNLLQQPLAGLNKTIINIQIIPDAELNFIPFELLLTEQSKTAEVNYIDLPYLIKEKAISYAYSAALQVENANKEQQSYQYNYAGFAPQYKNTDYDDLPFAEENVQQVARLLKGNTYFKDKAVDKNFKRDITKFKTFQLAMHGILNDENPLSSKLIFANAGNTDYALHAYELYNMQIPAQLGVLSACETGIGKQAKGEGIMSLSRAFTYAGCNSLVMSLWSIEDAATADIIYNFFKYLKKGKAKNEALRQAKLVFLQDPSHLKTHPVYWAGLVQSGNTSPIEFGGRNFWWIGIIAFFAIGLFYAKYRNTLSQI